MQMMWGKCVMHLVSELDIASNKCASVIQTVSKWLHHKVFHCVIFPVPLHTEYGRQGGLIIGPITNDIFIDFMCGQIIKLIKILKSP